ncbi:MAG TPA: tetratricopeptide repeat protein [Geobacteraceae bacterium]
MATLISANAGLAIFVHGNEADVISINNVDRELNYPLSSIPYLLSGATDVKVINKITKRDSLSLLQKEFGKNRALKLALIMLDESEDDSTVEMAADCLAELLSDPDILSCIENSLYSNVLPSNANVVRAKKYSQSIDAMESLLTKIEQSQPKILRYRESWNALSEDMFDDYTDKMLYEERLIASGAFKNLVEASDDHNKLSLAHIQCLSDLRDLRNSRAVITHWISGLTSKDDRKLKNFTSQNIDALEEITEHKNYRKHKIKPHDAFTNAIRQKQAIIPLLRKGDWSKTRKYVDDLVKSQSINSDPEHISKSLCDLAQHAKLVHNHSLQLELAKRAAEIAVDDGWAHCQVADAYICLSQYDNALKWLQSSEVFGQDAYAQTGFARILREQGKYDEAIAAFEKLTVNFPDSPIAYNSYAEVLKDVCKLEEALSVYNISIEKFPEDTTGYSGKASTLKALGRLDEALNLYNYAKAIKDDSYIGSGIADIFKLKGEYDIALRMYDEVIKKFPESSIPKCGRANVLRLKGQYSAALKQFRIIASEFPFDFSPKEGEAEVLKECGRLKQALGKYEEIIKEFPAANRSRNGRANVLKAMGEYEKALQAYDENVKDFPYDVVAWNGRADLLKQLGNFADSIEAYKRIAELNPLDKTAIYARAAIYVVLGQYSTALQLLPTEPPQTREDWFAQHIKGMIHLKSGDLDEAIRIFEDALRRVPYYNVAKYFRNALAVASLRLKRPQDVVGALDATQNDSIADVLSIHAYGESGAIKKAQEAYIRIEKGCPPFIVNLRDELAARYIGRIKMLDHDIDWIFAEECKIVLLDAA